MEEGKTVMSYKRSYL